MSNVAWVDGWGGDRVEPVVIRVHNVLVSWVCVYFDNLIKLQQLLLSLRVAMEKRVIREHEEQHFQHT